MFAWPATTLVDRVIPKSKILENARVTTRLKTSLTDQVREIRWIAKLAPETIKIPATPQIGEIAIFRILLKTETLDADLLDLFDKAIAPPILFSLQHPDKSVAHSAAYKRPNEANAQQWVTGPRFTSPFLPQPPSLPPLPAAIDLTRLYAALLAPLLPLAATPGEPLPAWVDRCADYQTLAKKIERTTAQVLREKQFNRKVELNRELNALKRERNALAF